MYSEPRRGADLDEGVPASSGRAGGDRRGAALILLCGAQLLLLVDFSIVNIALPQIRQALHFDPADLSWVVGAYALGFGGFLLLGGRLADLVGRRRMFVAGLLVFAVASLLAGLSGSAGALVLLRAVQGIGAALIAPALLSLITGLYPEGPGRDRAVGWFTAASASGFGLGVLAGGVLTEAIGWRAVFLMNVPLIAVAIPATYLLINAPSGPVPRRGYDVAGTILGVAGLTTVSYGLTTVSRAGELGRGAGIVAVGAVLLICLLLVERRAADPLLPLRLFRLPNVAAAYAIGALVTGVVGTATLLLSLYLQEVRQLSALWTGLSFLPFGITITVAARGVPRLVARLGLRWALASATLVLAAGAALLSAVVAIGSHLTLVLAGMLVVAAGFGVFFTLFTLAGTAGVPPGQQGVAAGLVNTSTQVGTAFATAILVTLAGVHSAAVAGSVSAAGFVVAFGVAAAILTAAAALAVTTIR
jgi:MFS family permease